MRMVLVYQGCYAKILQTGWFKHKHLFLTVLEAGSLRSRCWNIWYPVRPTSWFIQGCLLTVSSYGRRGERALWDLWGLHPHDLITFQRPHLLNPSHCGVRISTDEFGEDTSIQYVASMNVEINSDRLFSVTVSRPKSSASGKKTACLHPVMIVLGDPCAGTLASCPLSWPASADLEENSFSHHF